MYLHNGRLSPSPKWFYIVLPVLLFGFTALNFLIAQVIDVTALTKAMIAKKGELQVLFENMAVFAVFLGVLLVWYRYVHQLPLIKLASCRERFSWQRFFLAFCLWGAITLSVTLADYLMHPENYVANFQADKFAILLLLAIVFVPIQTAFEEFFFRGYLMQALGVRVRNAWLPLVFTSVTFGLMHIANPEVGKLGMGLLVYYITTGFFLGITTLMDDGLELAWGFHTANNFFTMLFVTSDWSVFQVPALLRDISEPQLGISVFLPLLLFPLLLWLYARKYGWKNWYRRLITP